MTTRYFVLKIKILNQSDIKTKTKQPIRGLFIVDVMENEKELSERKLSKYMMSYNKRAKDGFKIAKVSDIIRINNMIDSKVLYESLCTCLNCKFMNYEDKSIDRRVYIAGSAEIHSTVSSYADRVASTMIV